MWLRHAQMTFRHGFSTAHNPLETPIELDQALLGLNIVKSKPSFLNQVHGTKICMASGEVQTGDALISQSKEFVLIIKSADCYPVLIEDPYKGICAALHAGWRGTLGRILSKTLLQIISMGSRIQDLKVCIGPGICTRHFKVGPELIHQFKLGGFSSQVFESQHINLIQCLKEDAASAGLKSAQVLCLNRCTFEQDFYSYRRDFGKTGRMWSVIQAQVQ